MGINLFNLSFLHYYSYLVSYMRIHMCTTKTITNSISIMVMVLVFLSLVFFIYWL